MILAHVEVEKNTKNAVGNDLIAHLLPTLNNETEPAYDSIMYIMYTCIVLVQRGFSEP